VVEIVPGLGRIHIRVAGFEGFERVVVAEVRWVEGSTREGNFVGVIDSAVVVVLEALGSFVEDSRVAEGIQDLLGRMLGTQAGFESGPGPAVHHLRRLSLGNW